MADELEQIDGEAPASILELMAQADDRAINAHGPREFVKPAPAPTPETSAPQSETAPAAEARPEPAVPAAPEAQAPAPAAPAAPPAQGQPDSQMAELQRQLAEAQNRLAQYETEANRARVSEAVAAIRAKADAVKAELGGDIGDLLTNMADMLANQQQIIETDQMTRAEQSELQQHMAAWNEAPVMKAIYTAENRNDPLAKAHLGMATAFSDQIIGANPDIELPELYRQVEAKMLEAIPTLRGAYGLEVQAPPPPAAAQPAVQPVVAAQAPPAPKVTGPASLSDIPGGLPPTQNKPFDIENMNPLQRMQWASTAKAAEVAQLRNSRR